MRYAVSCGTVLACSLLSALPAAGAVIYNNLTPNNLRANNLMAVAARPEVGSSFEIEAGDDFVLGSQTLITSASFVGLFVGGTGTPSISDLVVEMYRVFPNDSNVARTSGPPTFSTSQVPTRVNSPSDVAFA